MQENANPFHFSVDHRVSHLDVLHMPLIAPVSEILVDSEVVEVVRAFEALDSNSQGFEFCSTYPPGSFALQFLQSRRKLRVGRQLVSGVSAELVEKVPESVNRWLAIFLAKREKEARAGSWRNKEIGGEGVDVFSAVATPVYLVSNLLANSRTDFNQTSYSRPGVERILDA